MRNTMCPEEADLRRLEYVRSTVLVLVLTALRATGKREGW